jgi:Super-infection exclusion protein B
MSDAISALAQKLLDSIGILKGPIFVVLTVLELLYFWDMNPFRVFTFLGRSPDILPILFLLWLFSGAFCLFDIVAWLGRYCKSFTKRHAERRPMYEKLQHHLTPEQETILAQLLLPKHDRHYFTHNDFVTDLVQSSIIGQTNVPLAGLKDDPVHNYSARYLCILSPFARRYLVKTFKPSSQS